MSRPIFIHDEICLYLMDEDGFPKTPPFHRTTDGALGIGIVHRPIMPFQEFYNSSMSVPSRDLRNDLQASLSVRSTEMPGRIDVNSPSFVESLYPWHSEIPFSSVGVRSLVLKIYAFLLEAGPRVLGQMIIQLIRLVSRISLRLDLPGSVTLRPVPLTSTWMLRNSLLDGKITCIVYLLPCASRIKIQHKLRTSLVRPLWQDGALGYTHRT